MNKIFIVDKKTKTGIFCSPYPEDILSHCHNPDTYIWVNIFQSNFDWVKKNLSVPNHFLKLAREKSIYPYFDHYKSYFFYKQVALNPNRFLTEGQYSWLNFIVSGRFVVTTHEYPISAFDGIDESVDILARHFCAGTSCFLSHIIGLLINDYNRFYSRLNNDIDLIGHNMLINKKDDLITKISQFEKELAFCLKTIDCQKNAFLSLKKYISSIRDDKSVFYFKEIELKLNDTLFSYRNLNSGLDSQKTFISNNLLERNVSFNRKNLILLKISITLIILLNIILTAILLKLS